MGEADTVQADRAGDFAARLLSQAIIDDAFTGRAVPAEVASASRAWPTSPEWSQVRLVSVVQDATRRVEEYRFTSAVDGAMQPVAALFTREGGRPVARLFGRHHWTVGREPMLPGDPSIRPGSGSDDPLFRYFEALAAADLEASVAIFDEDGYLQHSNGDTFRGHDRLREDFAGFYRNGPIKLRYCSMLDDGRTCVLEAIMPHGRPALAIYERRGASMHGVRLYL